MTDDLGTGELSSPATNGATGYSVSALSVGSNGGTKAIDASDLEARSTVTFHYAFCLASTIDSALYAASQP
jgi:hypothetical protein